MNRSTVRVIYFSPTGTSKSVVQAIADGFEGMIGGEEIDLTYPDYKANTEIGKSDLAVIGVPVYSGRVPELAARRLKEIKGNGSSAVIVAVYGNREYEDALVELRNIVVDMGFQVVAAAAFIGEHSFSTTELPIAAGRPDTEDLDKARGFGRSIRQLLALPQKSRAREFNIPGNVPYKEGMKNLPFTPIVDHATCSQCGTCVENCPSGAISLTDLIVMDVDSCILCASCIKICPDEAVSFESTPMAERIVALNENCSVRKEPELFF